MCTIFVDLNKGNEPVSREQFYAMAITNPNGFGMMFVEDGSVVVDKGYFNKSEFYDKYVEVRKLNTPIIAHFRISTSGTTDDKHCHPYALDKGRKGLFKTHINCDIAFAHNGILDYTIYDGMNDSQSYALDKLMSRYRSDNNFLESTKIRNRIEKEISGSRLAFLTKDKDVYCLGNGWSKMDDDNEGVFVANHNWSWRLESKYTSYYYDYNTKKSTKYNDFENQNSNKTYTSNMGTKYSLSGYDNFKYASGYYDDYDEYTWDDEENVYYSYDEYYTEKYLIDKMRNKNKREKDNRLWNDKYMERQVAKNSNRVFGRSWIDDVMDGCIK